MAEAVDKAYRTIRDGIMSGLYPQGAHITAQDLAAASGLSRTPVREAMRRLHSEGLIQIIPNRGAFVASWNEDDIEQFFDVVVLLEGFVAELAARNMTDEPLATLRRLTAEMDRLVAAQPPDVARIKEVNDGFHRLIWSICGNARVEHHLRMMVETEVVFGTLQSYNREELLRSAVQHGELVAAFEARDPVWAKSVMVSHMLAARHATLRSLHERIGAEPTVSPEPVRRARRA